MKNTLWITSLMTSTLILGACGSSPSSSDVTVGDHTSDISGACADYIAKTEEIMAKSGSENDQMVQATADNIAKMKEEWGKMSAEQQAQTTKGCQMLLDNFGDMLDKAANMPAQ